jgi:hypothetical protein
VENLVQGKRGPGQLLVAEGKEANGIAQARSVLGGAEELLGAGRGVDDEDAVGARLGDLRVMISRAIELY